MVYIYIQYINIKRENIYSPCMLEICFWFFQLTPISQSMKNQMVQESYSYENNEKEQS